MRSLFYLRCLRLAYRGDRVHGCTRVERDDAIAVGRVEDIHNVIIGDGDEKTLLQLSPCRSAYLVDGKSIHTAGVTDELLDEHGTHNILC